MVLFDGHQRQQIGLHLLQIIYKNIISSIINAETRTLLTRVKIENSNYELIPGSLLEITINFNLRNSLD